MPFFYKEERRDDGFIHKGRKIRDFAVSRRNFGYIVLSHELHMAEMTSRADNPNIKSWQVK